MVETGSKHAGSSFLTLLTRGGKGVYDLTPEVRLTAPEETYVDNYTSTVTITASQGP